MPTWLVIVIGAWLGLVIGACVVLLVDHLLCTLRRSAEKLVSDAKIDDVVLRATANLDDEIRELLSGGAR